MPVPERDVKRVLDELTDHLKNGIIPFWLNNGLDEECGGYLTCFDSEGRPTGDRDKYIVTQTRMVWGMSALHRLYPEKKALREAAVHGVDFLLEHFWDRTFGGWFWKTTREGTMVDGGKVVYGQSFAIYALAEYALATGDERGLQHARDTFDLLQKYAVDTSRGGYYENLELDWSVSAPGFHGGDRKSLDIHMHLMEAYTTLYQCSKEEIHRRRLQEVIDIILTKMIDPASGCGMNQFNLSFEPISAINIRRTWNAERATGQVIEVPTNTTSYGHNVELAWLLNRAAEVMGSGGDRYRETTKRLVDHSLRYGFDHDLGGVYRDGPHDGPPLVYDKEWWQNAEVLVGYLDAYQSHGDAKYLDAFLKTWEFDRKYMINSEVGEWRQLLSRDGAVIAGDIGNPWKAIYHTGRSAMECVLRLRRMT